MDLWEQTESMRFGNRKFRKQSGFSLVEIMVSVGILGILLSIAMVKYRDFKNKAILSNAGYEARLVGEFLRLKNNGTQSHILVAKDSSFEANNWNGLPSFNGSSITELVPGYAKTQDVVVGIRVTQAGKVVVEVYSCRLRGDYVNTIARYTEGTGVQNVESHSVGTTHHRNRC